MTVRAEKLLDDGGKDLCVICRQPRKAPDGSEVPHPICLVISVSQVGDFTTCKRRWFLSRVVRLPTLDRGYLTFGTVLHKVIERWMLADDQGNDPLTGQSVDLYPSGWERAEDGVAIDLQQQALVRRLMDKAVEDGVLERRPGRKIEHGFWLPVIAAHENADGVTVRLIGYIDVLLPGEIQDHKSSKAVRYAKSAEALAEDTQLLVYSKVALDELDRLRTKEQGIAAALADEDRVTVRHNFFCKDPTSTIVRVTRAEVTRAAIEARWAQVGKVAHEMLKVRKTKPEDWEKVPPPHARSVCNEFGGCAYRNICTKMETVQAYQKRLARVVQARVDSAQSNGVPSSTMGFVGRKVVSKMSLTEKVAQTRANQAKLLAGNASKNGTAAKPIVKPIVKPIMKPVAQPATKPLAVNGARPATGPAPQPAKHAAGSKATVPNAKKQALPPQPPAPWAVAGQDGEQCLACGGTGVNSKRTGPCKICDDNRAHAGLLRAHELYDLSVTNNVLAWVEKDSTDAPVTEEEEPPVEPEQEEVTIEDAPAPTSEESESGEQAEQAPEEEEVTLGDEDQEPEPEPDGEEVPGGEQFEGDTPQEQAAKRSRRTKTFTLLLGVIPSRGLRPSGVLWLDQYFDMKCRQLAEAGGKEHFTEFDQYGRKDLWRENLAAILEELAGKQVAAPRMADCGFDLKALIEAIRPHASLEYVPS